MFSDIKAIRYALRKTSEAIKKTAKKEGLTYQKIIEAIMKGDKKITKSLREVVNVK